MNWKELKEFCNSLPDEKLERKVVIWREDEAIREIESELLLEDHYIGEDDEMCYPLYDAGLTIEDAEGLGLEKVYSAGDPILWEKF